MKLLLVGYRDKNHSSAGGYDGIINYPGASILMGEDVPFGFIPVGHRGKCLNIFFLKMLSHIKSWKYDVVHFFYGEMMSSPMINSKCKTVATIHIKVSPDDKDFIRKLKTTNGIITLSTAQATLLREEYGVNAVFIPHGFNKPVFKQKDVNLDKSLLNIVVSGKNYRDEQTLSDIIEFCQEKRPDIRFHLLGQPERIKRSFANKSNSICYPRLSDDDYFSVMRACDYNFLPLTYATANNTLLEAEFLGIKSILPQIEGVLDYAAPAPLNMFYNNWDEACDLFSQLQKTSKSDELVEYAMRFSWESIYPQLRSFYDSLE